MALSIHCQDIPRNFLIQARLKWLGISQTTLAKRLRRSPTTIALALHGHRPTVLDRIERHLDYVQNSRKKTAMQSESKNAQEGRER